jgi:hydroxymethylpyrimidine pyrophosphatase-like HAD family hydrolase
MDWSRNRSYNVLFFGEIDLEKANKLLKDEGYQGLVMVDNGFSSLMKLELGIEKLHIYNLMPFGVNKASGIKLDKKIRNFDTQNCIALGDSLEDLKMADEVKYFFLMQNALEHKEIMLDELRKHDNVFITSDVMNKGWVEVIGYLVD